MTPKKLINNCETRMDYLLNKVKNVFLSGKYVLLIVFICTVVQNSAYCTSGGQTWKCDLSATLNYFQNCECYQEGGGRGSCSVVGFHTTRDYRCMLSTPGSTYCKDHLEDHYCGIYWYCDESINILYLGRVVFDVLVCATCPACIAGIPAACASCLACLDLFYNQHPCNFRTCTDDYSSEQDSYGDCGCTLIPPA